jgi:hypothetical protein
MYLEPKHSSEIIARFTSVSTGSGLFIKLAICHATFMFGNICKSTRSKLFIVNVSNSTIYFIESKCTR